MDLNLKTIASQLNVFEKAFKTSTTNKSFLIPKRKMLTPYYLSYMQRISRQNS